MPNRGLFLTTILLLALTLSLAAQNSSFDQFPRINSANINGSVRSLDNQPVTNARIDLRDNSTGAIASSTYTADNGMFELYNISPGDYEVIATQGTSETRDNVRVLANVDANLSLRMKTNGVAPDSAATVSVSKLKVPDKASKEYEKAAKAFHNNKIGEARKHVEKALSIYPNYAEALVIRGIIAIGDQKVDEGEADLQQAIQADPNYGMAYIAMGAALNQQGKFQDAQRTLERGISLSPDLWQGYFETSKAAMGLNDYRTALTNAERASTLSKEEYPPIHLIKAHALMGLKRFDQAVTELERFISRDPQGPDAANARLALDRAKAFAASNVASR